MNQRIYHLHRGRQCMWGRATQGVDEIAVQLVVTTRLRRSLNKASSFDGHLLVILSLTVRHHLARPFDALLPLARGISVAFQFQIPAKSGVPLKFVNVMILLHPFRLHAHDYYLPKLYIPIHC